MFCALNGWNMLECIGKWMYKPRNIGITNQKSNSVSENWVFDATISVFYMENDD